MNDPSHNDEKTDPRAFLEELGFELPEEAVSFRTEGSDIVFSIQNIEEAGCSIQVFETEERFPLNEGQTRKLKDAGFFGSEGFLIL